MKWSKNGFLIALVVVAAVAVGRGEEPREKNWKVQAGWVHQWGRGMDVSGPAPSLYNTLIPRGGSRGQGQLPPAQTGDIGPEDGVPTVWNFNDGYVFRDEQSAVDPGGDPNNPSSTHYWHYQNPSQYDGEKHTLTFHRDSGMQNAGAPSVKGDTSSDDFASDGIELKISRWLHTWKEWDTDIDLVLGLALFPDKQTLRNQRTTVQKVSNISGTYIYSDFFGSPQGGNWQPGLDHYGPGYDGQYHTLPGDTDNPIIPLYYIAGSEGASAGVIRDTVQIKGSLWRLRGEVGPMLTKPLTQRLSAYISPQFALEFVDASVSRTETVTYTDTGSGKTREVGTRFNRKSKTELVPGFLLTAGADYFVSDNWYVGGSLGWEWVSHNMEMKVGPDTAKFDLDGGEFSLYLGRKF